jgi:hypothetical protein
VRTARRLWATLLLLILASVALPAVAAPVGQDGSVTLGVRPFFGGAYRPNAWLPLQVTLENSGADRVGQLRVNERGRAVAYALPVDLPRGARKVVTVYARVESATRRLSVSFVAGEETLATAETRLAPRDSADMLVGVLAPNPGALILPERRSGGLRLATVELSLGELPELHQGLQSFSTLVIAGLPTETLSAAQGQALAQWVARGGKLLIGGGSGASAALAGLPPELRPVEVAGAAQLDDAGALTLLAGSTSAPALPITSVEARAVPGARVTAGSDAQPLLVERNLGRGQVAFFAAAIDDPQLAAWPDAPDLWLTLLRPAQTAAADLGRWNPVATNPDEFRAQSLASNLINLPSVDLPSLWLLGGLLLAYIALVGPLAYLILRRLDRLALGWVVLPAITLVFAVAAYGVGYSLRGGDVVVNQINIVEPLDGEQARVQSFIGIFSPSSREYAVEVAGQPLLRPVTLFGPWGGPNVPVEDGIFVQQAGVVSGLSIGQWSMRGLIAEGEQPFGSVESSVRYVDGRFEGEIVNNTGQTLREALLVRGAAIARLGDIPPGEARRGPLEAQNADTGMSLGYLIYRERFEKAINQPPDREIQRRQGVIDALYSNGPFPRGPAPLVLAWLDLTPHAASLGEARVDTSHLTLYTAPAQTIFADSTLDLGGGWAELRSYDLNGQPMSCTTPNGQGFATYNGNVEAVLRLPDELRGASVDELFLELSSDGVWPEQASFELFDRVDGDWRAIEFGGPGRWPIDSVERYFDPGSGELRLRFVNPGNAAMTSSCIGLDLSLKGRLP